MSFDENSLINALNASETRDRTFTEKGLEYQINVTLTNFRTAVSRWRNSCVKIESILSDSEDINQIRSERDLIQEHFSVILGLYQTLSKLRPQGLDDKTVAKYETVEEENHQLSKRIGDRLYDIQNESRSCGSRRSSKFQERKDWTKSNLPDVKPKLFEPPIIPKSTLVNDYLDNLPPTAEPVEQETAHNVIEIPINDLARLIADQNLLNRLPAPEPDVFSGEALEYPSWKCAFKTLIENRNIPPDQCMHYLRRYLGGEAKDAVRSYFLFDSQYAFEEAKQLLDKRYGDPFIIASQFNKKLEDWPKVPTRDGKALRRFSDFLRQCNVAMKSINTLRVFNDSRENKKLLEKLPDWLVLRWGRVNHEYKLGHNEFPPFEHFAKFIAKEADISCDPLTSLGDRKPSTSTHTKRTTFATEVSDSKPKVCFYCKGQHHIDVCTSFLNKTLEERKSYCGSNKLCFGCLNVGHRSKFCRKRLKCATCTKLHPSSLHGDYGGRKTEENTVKSTTSHRVTTTSSDKSSLILPVWVSHDSNPDKEIATYVIIDNQSDTTFALTNTVKALGLEGQPVQLSLSTMFAKDKLVDSSRINGLVVRGYNETLKIPLPATYTRDIMPANRSHIPTPTMAKRWPYLQKIAHKLTPLLNCEVGLLIGYDCARALVPRDVIPPVGDGPYAEKTDLGWGIVGIVNPNVNAEDDPIGVSHRIVSYEVPSVNGSCETQTRHISFQNHVKENILRFMELDFNEHCDISEISYEDRKFLDIMEKNIHVASNGHYEMPLPFRNDDPVLPNNIVMATRRLNNLAVRFCKDSQLKADYVKFMEDIIERGYAERVGDKGIEGHVNYIPHHAVYNPKKPGKVRVVFDCQAKYRERCINDFLLKGPDLTNTLIGVLCRFRKNPVAFMCDIEKMFYQFHVNESHRDYLRFLWWKDGNVTLNPEEFRMTVHLFGAGSSPGCSNFALKQAAKDNESKFGTTVSNFIQNDFYVDDGLTSVSSAEEAIDLIDKSKTLLAKYGTRLHKFVSNSTEVIESVSPNDRAEGVKNLDLTADELPIERALGIEWCIEADAFQFRIKLCDKPLTRRGILSTVSSIYDPLGFISPLLLVGKQILQELCRLNLGWDDAIPDSLRSRWEQWRTDLFNIQTLKIPRCFRSNVSDIASVELHNFSDASTFGYGQCSYLRVIDSESNVHCSLVMGKSRVTPLRAVTIPRLELTAAVVSVKVNTFLQKELAYPDCKQYFWTDSRVVLGYINNDIRRFQMFVANRVQKIRDFSEPTEWHHVKTKTNPADIASRGSSASELMDSIWFSGPDFLKSTAPLPIDHNDYTCTSFVGIDNPDVRKVKACVTESNETFGLERFAFCSDFVQLKRVIANCLKYRAILLNRVRKELPESHDLAVQDLVNAEQYVIKLVQNESFNSELTALNKQDRVQKNSPIYKLDPFIDEKGLLRVGGRLQNSELDFNERHPLILPRNNFVSNLIIRYYHEQCEHQGRGITVNTIRSSGFWIVGCSTAVSKLIFECVLCRKFRGRVGDQKMSDLPEDRLRPSPPFTYCGVDCFGPFVIKEGRKEIKRYGVLFTCMNCRAIHVETVNFMTTDSFINCLRRFLSIRGPIRILRCDNGSNFVGAKRELREAVKELDNKRVRDFLVERQCDFFEFKMNVPSASHMGGVWERQIRSVRNVLVSLLDKSGTQLDDESLRTFMYEAAGIVNSRPLTTDNLNDVTSLEPLTPNHLLTMKSKVLLPPPGQFQQDDVYSRKRWRRVQYLTNVFWTRWRVEFLQNLQRRQKWNRPARNLQVNDIVLVKDDDVHRSYWKLAKVVKADPESDGYVRKVSVMVGDSSLSNCGKRIHPVSYLDRPIHKLVLLVEHSN